MRQDVCFPDLVEYDRSVCCADVVLGPLMSQAERGCDTLRCFLFMYRYEYNAVDFSDSSDSKPRGFSSTCIRLSHPARAGAKIGNQWEFYMSAFARHTISYVFAQLIIVTCAPRLMRALVWAALIVSASEAAAELPARDTSANAIFRGCKAFVEGQAADAQLYGLGNFCAGIVTGLASVGQQLSPPEWQSCAPATTNAQH